MTEQQKPERNATVEFMEALVPAVATLLRLAPGMLADARRLAQALRSHPDPAIRPGAEQVEKAIEIAVNGDKG